MRGGTVILLYFRAPERIIALHDVVYDKGNKSLGYTLLYGDVVGRGRDASNIGSVEKESNTESERK